MSKSPEKSIESAMEAASTVCDSCSKSLETLSASFGRITQKNLECSKNFLEFGRAISEAEQALQKRNNTFTKISKGCFNI